MIRELTKSALSFAWALSLLGLKQTANLGRGGQQNGGDLFAPVTQIAVGQLDESMQGIFRSGENLQSRMVDLAFCWMNPITWFNPRARAGMGDWANPAAWMNPDNWMRSVTNITKAASGCCGQATGTGQEPVASAGSSDTVAGGGPDNGGVAPVSNESAAAGWGPMPGDE